MKRPVTFVMMLATVIVFLSVVQVFVSNRLSTTGIALGKIQDQIATYRKENELLKEQLLTITSYSHLASSAAQLGFVETKAQSQVFVTTPLPIALKQ